MSAKKLYAIMYFCNTYHSGQWSRGYKLMCLAQKLLKRKGLSTTISPRSWIYETETYKKLEDKYGDKI